MNMTPEEIHGLRARAGGYALKAVHDREDLPGLMAALVRHYLQNFEEFLDEYEVNWNANRTDEQGRVWPMWEDATFDMKARYIGLEIAYVAQLEYDRIDADTQLTHTRMPDAWEIEGMA